MDNLVVDLCSRRSARFATSRSVRSGHAVDDEVLLALKRHLTSALRDVSPPYAEQPADYGLLVALSRAYSEPLDLVPRLIDEFMVAHGEGLCVTLESMRSEPEGRRLVRPEVLLVLERLVADPFALQVAWPPDRPIAELHFIADAFARPF
jgi:hypothetical protein